MLDEDGLQRPQYFLCSKVISNQYTKPSKLKRTPADYSLSECQDKIKQAQSATREHIFQSWIYIAEEARTRGKLS
jgi:hypothetical protein